MHTLYALAVTELNILTRTRKRVIRRAIHAYLGCIGCDGVEYIDKDEEEGDEQGHPCIPWVHWL
jgi:hypothetical protein